NPQWAPCVLEASQGWGIRDAPRTLLRRTEQDVPDRCRVPLPATLARGHAVVVEAVGECAMARDMHSPSTSRESARVNKNPGTPSAGRCSQSTPTRPWRLGT